MSKSVEPKGIEVGTRVTFKLGKKNRRGIIEAITDKGANVNSDGFIIKGLPLESLTPVDPIPLDPTKP